jgi:hypothetical protein
VAWIDHSKSIFQSVPATSTTYEDQTIPNGDTWKIQKATGSAAFTADVHVLLVWDRGGAGEEILFATHGEAQSVLDRDLVGDGVKILSIVLENNSLDAQVIGGSYVAVEAP